MDFRQKEFYVPWDEIGLRVCDVLFACMEEDNPSGIGLSIEVGYVRGLGKPVIYVDGKNHRYFDIVRQISTATVSSLGDGITFLQSLPACKVYLAGGMRSGWQDEVTQAAPQHEYIDPRSKERPMIPSPQPDNEA